MQYQETSKKLVHGEDMLKCKTIALSSHTVFNDQ